jgi:hypothetical protein
VNQGLVLAYFSSLANNGRGGLDLGIT